MRIITEIVWFLYETVVFLIRQWPITLPAALGLVGIYFLLPKARRSTLSLLGAAAAAAALILGGWLLIGGKAATAETVLFFAFSGLAVVSGTLLVTQRNPVHAALSFALVVLSTCGLFLLQAAPFLMAATIIVYAGAIVVTFLFVIMLAQQSGMSDADHRSREPFLSALGSFVLLGALLYLLNLTYDTHNANRLLQRADETQRNLNVWCESLKTMPVSEVGSQLESLFTDFDQEAKAHSRLPDKTRLDDAIHKARSNWNDLEGALQMNVSEEETQERLRELNEALTNLKDVATQFRDTYGNLQPHGNGPERFSTFSGPRANRAFHTLPRDEEGRVAVPAENVTAVGKSLFTDYLVPVELAGMLLLVATIGAIAISSRRTGGLR
jgi:NADH:ubiquinone oxidoreductase subunit 6 (subunit J)